MRRPRQTAEAAPACEHADLTTCFTWRGDFAAAEVNALHAEAFATRIFSDTEWPWEQLVEEHSLGWVTARQGDSLVGFVNVLWDGIVHAWIQDVMVAGSAGRHGIGTRLLAAAAAGATAAGCEYLHVDFEPGLQAFYIDACGFSPTRAGLLRLTRD